MRRPLGLGGARGQGPGPRAVVDAAGQGGGDHRLGGQVQPPLAAALKLQVDLGQQARVDQRAVLLAFGQRYLEALTQGVERVVHARKALLGQGQAVDPAGDVDQFAAGHFQLAVDEGAVEAGVVGDHRRVADELQEGLTDVGVGELGLVGQELDRHPVHRLGARLDVAFGVDVAMEGAPRGDEVVEFHTGQLDQPVARTEVEPGGLGVEDDLARHGQINGTLRRRSQGSGGA